MPSKNVYQTAIQPNVAVQLAPANANRLTTLFRVWGDNPVFVGKDNTVTPQNGFPVTPEDGMLADVVGATDAIWVTSTGPADARLLEVTN